jgi:hypothetical protein
MPEDQRGWQTETRTVQCRSCKAVSVFDPKRVGQRCEFCGSPEIVDYQEIKSPIRPQSLLPFKVAETAVREQIRRWYKSKWLAPNALKSRALVDTVKGIYIPYWTFDAQVVCPWDADLRGERPVGNVDALPGVHERARLQAARRQPLALVPAADLLAHRRLGDAERQQALRPARRLDLFVVHELRRSAELAALPDAGSQRVCCT